MYDNLKNSDKIRSVRLVLIRYWSNSIFMPIKRFSIDMTTSDIDVKFHIH